MFKTSEARLTWAFGLALLLLAGNALISYRDLLDQTSKTRQFAWDRLQLDRVATVETALLAAECARQGWALDGGPGAGAEVDRALGHLALALTALDAPEPAGPPRDPRVGAIAQAARRCLAGFRAAAEHPGGRPDLTGAEPARRDLMAFNALVAAFEVGEKRALADRVDERRSEIRRAFVTFSLVSTLALVTVGTTYRLVRRHLVQRKAVERAVQDSETRFRLLFESVGEGIYGVDTAGRCTFCNPAALRILGFATPGAVLGREMHQLVHHTRADGSPFPAAECPIYATFRSGRGVLGVEDSFFRADGKAVPVEYRAHAIRRGAEILGAVVTFVDITDRLAQEEHLRATDERLRLMVESVSDYAIFSVDLAGRVSSWNTGAGRLFGFDDAQILGEAFGRLFSRADQEAGAPAAELARTGATGRSEDERWHVRADGSRFLASGTTTAVRDPAGRLLGYTKVARDITRSKQAEHELRAAKEAAEAAARAKNAFLSTMGHELRTPLNAIIGYSELLGDEASDRDLPGFVEDLERIREAGYLLLRLINQVLDLSRIESGSLAVAHEPFDLGELVREVVRAQTPFAERRGNSVQVHYPPDLGTFVGDFAKLGQCLGHLLNNAIKFTEAGTVTLRVDRAPDEAGRGWLAFRVADDGIGMTRDEVTRLFQPFVQGDASPARQYGGSGLGLTIASRFCRLMGGSIEVSSEPGAGSTFVLKLPIRDDHPEDGDPGGQPAGWEARPEPSRARP